MENETDPNALAPATDATVPAAAPTGGQQDNQALQAVQAEANDWKKRFAGLQGTYQREQEKLRTVNARVTELETALAGIHDERSNLLTELEQLRPLQSELTKARSLLERHKVIATEFPDLIQFEAKGLLPTDVAGDDLRSKLGSFKEMLGGVSKDAVEKMLDGGVPPAPKGQPPKGPDELRQAMIDAFRNGKMEDYSRLSTEYYTVIQQGAK